MPFKFDIRTVRARAKGRWDYVFSRLAPSLAEAMERPGRHGKCPVHGGKDAFRLFPDFQDNGSCVCNTCGVFRDGFATLCWVNKWSFREALEAVGSLLLDEQSAETVLDVQPIGQVIRGPIFGISVRRNGGPYPVFTVSILDELTKKLVRCEGEDLRRLCQQMNLQTLNRIELTLVARERILSCGRVKEREIWTATLLKSRYEEMKANVLRQRESAKRARLIEEAWTKASPINVLDENQRPLIAYLQSRGIDPNLINVHDDIRFCRSTPCLENGRLEHLPAMIAAVRNVSGELVTLHKTYLSPTGEKAAIESPKRIAPLPENRTLNGCAIRIGKPDKVLGLAEGIETALSVTVATGLTCWPCINANCLKTVQIPDGIETVLIFADKDRSGTGESAAIALQERLRASGLKVRIYSPIQVIPPQQKGIDWNDVLLEYGASGFCLPRNLNEQVSLDDSQLPA